MWCLCSPLLEQFPSLEVTIPSAPENKNKCYVEDSLLFLVSKLKENRCVFLTFIHWLLVSVGGGPPPLTNAGHRRQPRSIHLRIYRCWFIVNNKVSDWHQTRINAGWDCFDQISSSAFVPFPLSRCWFLYCVSPVWRRHVVYTLLPLEKDHPPHTHTHVHTYRCAAADIRKPSRSAACRWSFTQISQVCSICAALMIQTNVPPCFSCMCFPQMRPPGAAYEKVLQSDQTCWGLRWDVTLLSQHHLSCMTASRF